MSHRALALALILCAAPPAASAQAPAAVRYGANPAAGKTFVRDGVSLYYETYGQGPPLLIIHGNGGNIASLRAQIDYFRAKYG